MVKINWSSLIFSKQDRMDAIASSKAQYDQLLGRLNRLTTKRVHSMTAMESLCLKLNIVPAVPPLKIARGVTYQCQIKTRLCYVRYYDASNDFILELSPCLDTRAYAIVNDAVCDTEQRVLAYEESQQQMIEESRRAAEIATSTRSIVNSLQAECTERKRQLNESVRSMQSLAAKLEAEANAIIRQHASLDAKLKICDEIKRTTLPKLLEVYRSGAIPAAALVSTGTVSRQLQQDWLKRASAEFSTAVRELEGMAARYDQIDKAFRSTESQLRSNKSIQSHLQAIAQLEVRVSAAASSIDAQVESERLRVRRRASDRGFHATWYTEVESHGFWHLTPTHMSRDKQQTQSQLRLIAQQVKADGIAGRRQLAEIDMRRNSALRRTTTLR